MTGDRRMNHSLTPKKPFAAPTVDRLSVRVVVDSRYERFLPKATHPFVAIEHVGQIPGRQMTSLACEWGLSLHLDSPVPGPAHSTCWISATPRKSSCAMPTCSTSTRPR